MQIKIFFLPNKSARYPFKAAPIVAPTRVDDTRIPCIYSDKFHSSFIKSKAPEITPVSKPDKSPPRATINATRYKIREYLDFC